MNTVPSTAEELSEMKRASDESMPEPSVSAAQPLCDARSATETAGHPRGKPLERVRNTAMLDEGEAYAWDPDEEGDDEEAAETNAAPALAALRSSRDEDGLRFQYPRTQYDELQPGASAQPCGETEGLLNALIAECGALLRDVAFRSACQAPDVDDRIRFLAAAENLARTGAAVGDSIGRLRSGGTPPSEVHRHELVYTHARTPLPPSGGRR